MSNTQEVRAGDVVVIGNGKAEWLVLIVKENGSAWITRRMKLGNGTTRHFSKLVETTAALRVVRAKKVTA